MACPVNPMATKPTPNDQRSNAKNPNNPAGKAAQDHRANQSNPGSAANKAGQDNRANQMNPEHRASKGKT